MNAPLDGVQLLGRHLLADQMVEMFGHEGVRATRFDGLHALLHRGDRRQPVIVWNTDNRRAVRDGVRLRLAGFAPHRYWIGGDVLRLFETRAGYRAMLVAANRFAYRSHTANSAWLADELAAAGLRAAPMPFNPACCATHWPVAPDPDGPYRVLFYSLSGHDAIYRPELLHEVAAALPAVRFLAVGNDDFAVRAPNIEQHGALDGTAFRRLAAEADALLRITTHDGFPRIVLEAMSSGIDVIFNRDVPHAHRADDAAGVVATLARLAAGPRGRNLAARDWAFAHHSAATWVAGWRRRVA